MIRLKKKEEKSGEGGEIEREIGRIHSSLSGYLHSRVGNVSMGEMNEIRNAKHLIFIARIYEIFPRVLYLPLSLSLPLPFSLCLSKNVMSVFKA